MPKTSIVDVIVPTTFERYTIERTAQLSELVQSGIVEHAPEFDALASGGGREVRMPYWRDLSGDRQILSDSSPLSVAKIDSGQDIARIHNDGNAWSWSEMH